GRELHRLGERLEGPTPLLRLPSQEMGIDEDRVDLHGGGQGPPLAIEDLPPPWREIEHAAVLAPREIAQPVPLHHLEVDRAPEHEGQARGDDEEEEEDPVANPFHPSPGAGGEAPLSRGAHRLACTCTASGERRGTCTTRSGVRSTMPSRLRASASTRCGARRVASSRRKDCFSRRSAVCSLCRRESS